MGEYKKKLENEIGEVEIKLLEESLKEFFKDKFKITKSDNWLDARKGENLIAHFNLHDEEIYIINEKYESDLSDFGNFYEKKVGVDFKLIL